MRINITAVINHNGDEESLERTVKSVSGWVSGIYVVRPGGSKSGHQIAGWLLGLNSGEEVSIPLKREIRTLLGNKPNKNNPGTYVIPVIRNVKDTWRLVCPGSARLFFAGSSEKTGNLDNPIRDYIKHKPCAAIPEGAKIKRVLVVKLRGIGDTVLLTPLFLALKKSFPGVLTEAVVKSESALLLAGQKNLASAIAYEGFFKTLLKIWKKKYDLAIVPQASFRSALLARLSGATLLSVNNHNGKNYFSSVLVDKPQEYENAVERDLDCVRALGLKASFSKPKITVTAVERKKGRALLRKFGVSKNVKAVIINPSASKRNKLWPEKYFAAFTDMISAGKNVRALVLTDPAKAEMAAATVSLSKSAPVLMPPLRLRDVLGLLSVAGLYVGNDSGLSHAAAALGTPTITIVGPDEPRIFHPYKEEDGNYIVSKDRYCKPCWKED